MDETKVRSATSKAWGSEFSVEADDEDGVGIWKDIKLPMLIAEYIKDEDLDHRGHLVMTMKSALAAYRLYHMKQEVVFGLLIDRDTVSLSVGWGSEDGQYATTKVSLGQDGAFRSADHASTRFEGLCLLQPHRTHHEVHVPYTRPP